MVEQRCQCLQAGSFACHLFLSGTPGLSDADGGVRCAAKLGDLDKFGCDSACYFGILTMKPFQVIIRLPQGSAVSSPSRGRGLAFADSDLLFRASQ